MNRMEGVAKLLRVNLEEKFKIKGSNSTYWITEQGFFEHNNWVIGCQDTEKILVKILMGEYEIIRGPFSPIEGQEFWCYDPFTTTVHRNHFKHSNPSHRILKDKQMIFRTREEVDEYVENIKNTINKERGIPV